MVKGASLKQFKSDIQDEYLFNGMGSRIEGNAAPCDVYDTRFQCGENRTKRPFSVAKTEHAKTALTLRATWDAAVFRR